MLWNLRRGFFFNLFKNRGVLINSRIHILLIQMRALCVRRLWSESLIVSHTFLHFNLCLLSTRGIFWKSIWSTRFLFWILCCFFLLTTQVCCHLMTMTGWLPIRDLVIRLLALIYWMLILAFQDLDVLLFITHLLESLN